LKKLILAGTAVAMMAFAGVASATGPEGAIVTPAGHVCSGTTGPIPMVPAAPGGSCTYTSSVAGGYQGDGFTLVATHNDPLLGTVTDLSVNCPVGTPCTTGQATPIPALDTVTVTSTGGAVAAGTVTGGPTP